MCMQPTPYLLPPTRDNPLKACAGCAPTEGLLVQYPAIRDSGKVGYIGFARSRPDLATAPAPAMASHFADLNLEGRLAV